MFFSMFLALLAQPALAFNLDIWGVGHVSFDFADDGVDDSEYVASNSSRLGFSGEHDLGNGLSLIYRYETGVDLTGQSGNDGNGGGPRTGEFFTATRDSFVGIKGGFGTLQFGKNGGLNEWVYDFNPFGDWVGDLGNIWGGTGLAGRISNQARYTTPDIGGFNVGVTYAPEEGSDNTDIFLVKANFGWEGLKLGAAYMSQGTGVDPVTLRDRDEHDAFAVTGSYNFGMFTVGAGFQNESDIPVGVQGSTLSDPDRDSFTVGATAALGNGTLKAQFTDTSGDANETDASQIAVGYDYNLGKNTVLYIAYASTDNDDFPGGGGFTANNYGHGDAVSPGIDPVTGFAEDVDVISIGLVYKFNAPLWPR
jgi:predicted porin